MSILPIIEPTELHEVLTVRPRVFSDERGYFTETYNQESFNAATGLSPMFVQDNESMSRRDAVRGIHYQLLPTAQGKLIRSLRGAIWDVAVDLRHSSATFGKWVSFVLTDDDPTQLWIPAGFGHGFAALSDSVRIAYKTTDLYDPATARAVRWDDPQLAIEWPVPSGSAIISEQDGDAPLLDDADVFD